MRRISVWLVIGLLTLGLAARCRQYFSSPSYWHDEAYLLLNIFSKSYMALLGPLSDDQAAPPLFLWLLRWLYQLGGGQELVMRLPAFMAGVAALFIMLPLARLVLPHRGWIIAVGLCALSHHGMTHSYEVKPYSGDLLMSELVLLAVACTVLLEASERRQRVGRLGLLVAAAFGPWLSFTSVFMLGGASAALLTLAWQRRRRWDWICWLSVTGTLALSCLLLWQVTRQQDTAGLHQWWSAYFLDSSSPLAAGRWMAASVVEVGHYGATGLGIPLAILGVLGLPLIMMRSRPMAAALLVPLFLAWLASAIHRYPMGDRLVFFLSPCLWLAVAAGVGELLRQRSSPEPRLRFFGPTSLGVVLSLALLAPGAVRMAKYLVVSAPKVDYLDAFTYVHKHRLPGDAIWVSHPQVYEVYFGREPLFLGAYTPLDELEQTARERRVWMVFNPQVPGATQFPEVFTRLRLAGSAPTAHEQVPGLEIELYEPAAAVAGRLRTDH
jgi:uncharacterized membrane protein